jgi:cytochrome c oxidase cbb3-type subunit 2
MFTVDAESHMGRRRIPNEEIAKAAEDVKGKNELEAVIAYLQVLGIHRK